VQEIRSAAAVERFLGTGVAVPGPISTDGDLLDLPLQEVWRNVPLRSLLTERLDASVLIQKDGVAAATGERWIGGAGRAEDFVYLYLGTGIGSGLMINGEPYQGISANAGEFGQLCAISIGAFDARGRPLLVRECNPPVSLPEIAVEHGYTGPTRYRDICAAVGRGDPAATAAAQQIADVIARGTAALIDILDLPLIVLGGPSFEPELQTIMIDSIAAAVNEWPTAHRARQVRVEPSVLKTQAAAIGGASAIFHQAFTTTDRRRAIP
jgi:predicted NBD/HSP70 family sugar kinase